MRILAVTTKSPWPLTEGRALRTYNLLKQAAKKHEITLCSFVQSEEEQTGVEKLREFCADVHSVPLYLRAPGLSLLFDAVLEVFGSAPLHARKYAKRRMRRLLGSLLRSGGYDVLHLDMLHLAELGRVKGAPPVVLVEHNVESQILERRYENETSRLRRIYIRYQQKKLERYEVQQCNRASQVVSVSDDDGALLQELGVTTTITTVPNAVDTEFFSPSSDQYEPNTLVYVGSMAWFPNEDAVDHFFTDILSIVQTRIPEVRLRVIGHIPDRAKVARWQSSSAVELLGFVDDIRPHVARAAVYVVPLRIGGGTRLKILDALAMGKAVVSTAIGCEGLGLRHGVQALVASGPQEFAAHVCQLLTDRDQAARLGQSGRDYVYENFRWEEIAKRMETVYRAAAEGET